MSPIDRFFDACHNLDRKMQHLNMLGLREEELPSPDELLKARSELAAARAEVAQSDVVKNAHRFNRG